MRHVVAAVMAAWAAGAGLAAQGAPDPKLVEAGKKVYEAQKCVTCHMIEGKGNKMFPLDGVGTRLPAADLRRWITHPAEMEAKLPKPPTMKMSMRKYVMSEADLDALVAYMVSLKEKK